MGKYNKARVIETKNTLGTKGITLFSDGIGEIAHPDHYLNNEREMFERIASCWNACLNLENPQDDIKKLREILEYLQTNINPDFNSWITKRIDEALSLFKEVK